MMLSDVCLYVWRLLHTSGWWPACAAGQRLDGAYWLIGLGSAGLAQGCRCALPLQAWAGHIVAAACLQHVYIHIYEFCALLKYTNSMSTLFVRIFFWILFNWPVRRSYYGLGHILKPYAVHDYSCPKLTCAAEHLRSAACHQLTVPRHRLSMFGRRPFAVAGPTMFNALPDDLRDPAVSI